MQLYESSIDNTWSFLLLKKIKRKYQAHHLSTESNKSLPFCGSWHFCWFFLVYMRQPASIFLGAAGSKMTSLLCLGFVADCQLEISLSVAQRSFIIHRRWTSYCWKHSKAGMKSVHFPEPSETYTISFYRSKRVLDASPNSRIRGRDSTLIGRILTNVWSYFIFHIGASKNWYQKLYVKKAKFSFLKEVIIFYIYFPISSFPRVQPHSRSHYLSVEQVLMPMDGENITKMKQW